MNRTVFVSKGGIGNVRIDPSRITNRIKGLAVIQDLQSHLALFVLLGIKS